jgi:hypothetical protein
VSPLQGGGQQAAQPPAIPGLIPKPAGKLPPKIATKRAAPLPYGESAA